MFLRVMEGEIFMESLSAIIENDPSVILIFLLPVEGLYDVNK